MRIAIICLGLLVLVLQYKLWFSKGGLQDVARLKRAIYLQQKENTQLAKRNATLLDEVTELKQGKAAAQERAREDLGMIKKNEVYYQLVPKSSQS
jgi:cell division protein FtsB